MPPNDFVLRLVDGASDEPEQVLYSAYAKIPFTVGTNGTWRVRAADVAPVHVVVMHDGASLLVRSEGPHRAWLNGRPLEDAWVRVTTFAHLAFGAARISLIPRASGAEKVANEGATMVADSTDELLAALASERAHVPSVGDATTEVPSPLDLPASETAARAVAIRKPASEAPSKHDAPSPAAFDPYRTMVMPAPPPRPAASPPSRIAPMSLASPSMPPRTMASRSAPSSMPPAPMHPVPSRPVHVAPSTPPSRIEPSVGDPRRAPTMPHEPARAIDAGAPSRVVVPPSTEWISARSVVGTPGSGWHRPAAHVRAGAYDGSPAPATMAVPMVERSAATTSATTDRRPAPSPAVSVRSPHLDRVAVAWKQASPVRKLTVALVVPATLAVLFSCLRPKADASSAQLASAPPPSSPSLASSSPPPVPSPPSSPSLPPPVPSPPSSPSPASSAPSVAPAAVAAAATPSSATPTPVAAPPASPSPSPRAPAGSGTRKTTERVALDNAAEGSYASAAELYAELAAQHPENPVFREASRILATKAKGPNGT